MSSRASTRAVKCGANLHQIGIAFQGYKEKMGRSPDIGTMFHGLGEYLEDQNMVYVCPEVADTANTSYGVHMCVHRLLGESAKIIMMDAHVDTLEYEGVDLETWNEDMAPRHHGMVNVLFYDGSVRRKSPSDFNPYDSDTGDGNLTKLWKPILENCESPCGIQGTYYALKDFDGVRVTRIDEGLHLPFGNAPFFKVPYNIPLEGAKPNNPWPLKTGKWTGQIKAEFSEEYTFYVCCDNEAWLDVDGKQVLHRVAGGAWGVQQFQAATPVTMQAGQWMDIEVRFKEYHAGTPSHISVKWQSASTPLGEIPSCNMRPVAVSD